MVHLGAAMSKTALLDALCACRAFIQGPLVVKAGAASGVFQNTIGVHVNDVRCNYDVPPKTHKLQLKPA